MPKHVTEELAQRITDALQALKTAEESCESFVGYMALAGLPAQTVYTQVLTTRLLLQELQRRWDELHPAD